jgi:hypothetical protein
MRRFFRSSFLFLLIAALVAPLPAGEAAATLTPICCLGKGEHHCLGHELGGEKSLGFSADSKCPYSPLALAALHGPDLAAPVHAQSIAVIAQSAPVVWESSSPVFSLAAGARPERGPPAFSLN